MTVFVLGSLNIDLVSTVDRMPKPGETVTGSSFATYIGGKGLNQAVGCSRAGAEMEMIGAVGDDSFGDELLLALKLAGISNQYIARKVGPSGVAVIEIDAKAENRIIVIPGANGQLAPTDIPAHIFADGKKHFLLTQLEIPIATVRQAFIRAKAAGFTIALNPAPAQPLPPEILELIDIIIPNQYEAELLTGIKVIDHKSALLAGEALLVQGVKEVVLTLGEEGAMYISKNEKFHQAAISVVAVDTTAAGDTFCGALIAKLSQGVDMRAALSYASVAAGLSTTITGALPSIPTSFEVSAYESREGSA